MEKLEKIITEDLRASIKNRDAIRTSTLRMIIASMQNLSIEKRTEALEDSEVLRLLAKQTKQHQDSIESFKKGGREDLVEKETRELEILRSYLPEQLSEKEIEGTIKRIISETGAGSKADFGKIMKLGMEELKGRTDGRVVSSIVQRLLSEEAPPN